LERKALSLEDNKKIFKGISLYIDDAGLEKL
jgi:hypothetical protein